MRSARRLRCAALPGLPCAAERDRTDVREGCIARARGARDRVRAEVVGLISRDVEGLFELPLETADARAYEGAELMPLRLRGGDFTGAWAWLLPETPGARVTAAEILPGP
jgi:hypothetical protein